MNKRQEPGGVSEADFEIAFEQTPIIDVSSVKELREAMNAIGQILHSDDWQQRVDNLRQIRSIFKGNQLGTDEYILNLRNLDQELKSCICDLRSQVVREACITVAYLAKEIKIKLDIVIEQLIESLLNLVPNGARIMSSSGKVALKFIIYNIQSVRLLPFFLTSMNASKSTSVRQFCSDLVNSICEKWPTKCLDKHTSSISETLRNGICDADEQARCNSRNAFCWFNMKFPQSGDKLLQSLDSSKQKVLQQELNSFSGDHSTDTGSNFFREEIRAVKMNSNTGTPKSTNVFSRSRTNSSKSDTQSANNSNEYLYVKPHSAYGYQSVRTKIRTSIPEPVEDRGKRPRVSQSQHGSRDPSPSYKSTYTPYTNGGAQDSKNYKPFNRRGNTDGHSSLRAKDLDSGFMDRLKRTRTNSSDYYQSDDNASEISSVALDNLPSFNELLVLLNSKLWSDRKRGLIKTEIYLMECNLKPSERKSLIDIFNSMFLENQTVVVKKFLVVLCIFLDRYYEHLNDWQYALLGKLLVIHSNDRLKCCKSEVNQILKVSIDRFGPPAMFMYCCKYLTDKTHELTLKLKISLLEYLKSILTVAQPSLLDCTGTEVGSILANVISMTNDTKSTELRKISSSVVIKLFDLNAAQFSRLLKTQPTSIQDRATAILDLYFSAPQSSTEDTTSSDMANLKVPKPKTESGKTSEFIKMNTELLNDMSLKYDNFDKNSLVSSNSNRSGTSQNNNLGTYHKVPNNTASHQNKHGHIPILTTNNISVQRYLSSQNSHTELSTNNNSATPSPNVYPTSGISNNVDYKYNPELYNSGPIGTSHLSRDENTSSTAELAPEEIMKEILKELSNHDDRQEERTACLFKLIKIIRENTLPGWVNHFKTLLFLILETMADKYGDIRAQAIRVLQELVKSQAARFVEYTHLTILRVLEAHNDGDKSVVKAAEECSRVLSVQLPRESCLKMLINIISDSNPNPLCLAALKTLIKLTKSPDPPYSDADIEMICHGLSQVANHKDSLVRKESILCLVEIHSIIGDRLLSMVKLSSLQIKLLDVYIKKNNSLHSPN